MERIRRGCKNLNLKAILDARSACEDADYVVIATPTNYDSEKNYFDTSAVEAVIKLVNQYNPQAYMIIKSTIPVGYTKMIRLWYEQLKLLLVCYKKVQLNSN